MSHWSAQGADHPAQTPPHLDAPFSVGLVLPCFNDTQRLALFLPGLCAGVSDLPFQVTLQVVDDGSSPENRTALEEFIGKIRACYPAVRPVLFQDRNQGKGAAILRGWEALKGTAWLGFLDADGAISAAEVRRVLGLLPASSSSAPCFFGSRIQMKGRTVKRNLKRHLMGRFFATLVGEMIDPGIYDSQCGFKLLPAAAYDRIKPFLREKRFAFDVELLAALNHFGSPIQEIPIDWCDIPGSKVSLILDPLRMFCAVRGIRSRFAAMGAGGGQVDPCQPN